jgi:predicted dehydrogenase
MISGAHAMAASVLKMPVIAVASRSQEKSTERANQLNAKSVEYSQLPSGADIVVVATPPAQHFDHAVYSLQRGAAVIIEKPLAYTLNEADRLMSHAEQNGQKMLYAENLAYAPIVHAFIKRAVLIGSVTHMSFRTVQSLPAWGDFTTAQWGGGALFDLGVHPIAIAVLVGRAIGAGEVVAVSAKLDGEITDTHAEVKLTFANGLKASVVTSWQGSQTPEWNFQVASDQGVVRAELMPNLILEHNGDEVSLPPATAPIPFIQQFGYTGQLQAFADDLASRTTPFMDIAFGRWMMEIVCAGYVSARQNSTEVAVPSGCDRFVSPLQLWKGP